MRLLAWAFTWLWVPVTWMAYVSETSGPERAVNYLVALLMTWGASTWTLWKLGVLQRIYGFGGGRVLPAPPRCPKCGLLKVPGVNHQAC